ncbi:MAG: glycosyltransferase [Chloroflexi bacterium]|nr:glycosyltransferase [Chloroflexota bacterium]
MKAHSTEFRPAWLVEIELAAALPDIVAARTLTGELYRRACALVRLHSQPLGLIELPLGADGLRAAEYAPHIWREWQSAINDHLQADGCPPVSALTPLGLAEAGTPKCLQARAVMLADAPFVSVIVATRDRPIELAAALKSLQALDYPHYEIIVVDNAPATTATAELIQRWPIGRSSVRYVREDEPGLAIAHNRGLLAVTAPIVAFTDDDVIVDQHWLTELVRGFSVSDQVACATGMILPAEIETPAQAWLEQFGGFTKGFAQRVFDLETHRLPGPLYPYTVGRFGSGASMAFKTAVLRQLGGFDSALGAGTLALGGDDLAAFFQIISAGYQLVYQPSALLYHRHRREYEGLARQAYGYGAGLTAYLTKTLVDRPARLLDFVARLPAGVAYAISPRSPKNSQKQAGYPAQLTWLERRGMLAGPFAYLRSRWHTRRIRSQFEDLSGGAQSPETTSRHMRHLTGLD